MKNGLSGAKALCFAAADGVVGEVFAHVIVIVAAEVLGG